jgi:PST family polysaccharide transporter
VNYVALNGDNFIVGRSIGSASLGLYNRAYLLMNLPFTYAASVMSSVLFPAFAEVQGDSARLRRGYLLMTRIMAMISAPMMVTLAVVAPYLVRTLYGPQWSGTVAPLQILCLAGYFRALYHLGGIVAQSVGRVYGELRNQIVYAISVVLGATAGSQYGLPGVATGVAFAILIMFVATGRLAMRVTSTPWQTYLRVQIPGIATAAITGGCAVSARLLLEAKQASGLAITLGVLAAAALPWSIAVIWQVGEPGFEPLHPHLPGWSIHFAEMLRMRVGGPISAAAPLSRTVRDSESRDVATGG